VSWSVCSIKGVDPVGKEVRVKDVVMTVTGVFHDKSNQGAGIGERVRSGIHLRNRLWRRRASRQHLDAAKTLRRCLRAREADRRSRQTSPRCVTGR
jgi:F0F1-type ATP synthase beta subunit